MNKWTNVILLYRNVYTYIHAPLYISIYLYTLLHSYSYSYSFNLSAPFPFHLPPFPPSLHFSNPLLSPFSLLPPPVSPARKVTKRKANQSNKKQRKVTKRKENQRRRNRKRAEESEIWPDMYVYIYQALAINYNHSYFHI